MSDPRLTPNAELIDQRTAARVSVSYTDLCRMPDGPRDRQLIFGDLVTVLNATGTWAYVQAAKDGYCGYVRQSDLGAHAEPTHKVVAPATHAYQTADFKSPDMMALTFGSHLAVAAINGAFAQTEVGSIPTVHIAPVDQTQPDPAEIAALFLGTPYLWGGNTRWGIDCSGLVQAALMACGIPCPGDSDMQMTLGRAASGGYQRNDLLFWKGHVALVVDGQTLIHANASAMACVYEGIDDAITRIKTQGDGAVTAHRRL